MEIIKGKFWKDGKIVPLEFGNMDQIKLMNKELKYVSSFEEDGYEPIIWEEERLLINFNFKCPRCSYKIRYESEFEDRDHYNNEIEYEGITCKGCNTKFRFKLDDYGELKIRYADY